MGIFGWIKRKAASICTSISDRYKKFTGQTDFDEADKLYQEVKARFERHKAQYEKEVHRLTNEIDNHVNGINNAKMIIKTELFPAFADKISRLKDVNVTKEFIAEAYMGSNFKVDNIKHREELFLIDFNKSPFKSNALAIITLGIWTRKKAKETLLKVKEEKKRIEEEMQRMETELVRLQRLNESLKQIEGYYTSLIDIYKAMLLRLDNSVNYLVIKSFSLINQVSKSYMSVKYLPKSQQKELEAICTISKIMKTMVEKQIVINSSYNNVAQYESVLSKSKDEAFKQFEAA